MSSTSTSSFLNFHEVPHHHEAFPYQYILPKPTASFSSTSTTYPFSSSFIHWLVIDFQISTLPSFTNSWKKMNGPGFYLKENIFTVDFASKFSMFLSILHVPVALAFFMIATIYILFLLNMRHCPCYLSIHWSFHTIFPPAFLPWTNDIFLSKKREFAWILQLRISPWYYAIHALSNLKVIN